MFCLLGVALVALVAPLRANEFLLLAGSPAAGGDGTLWTGLTAHWALDETSDGSVQVDRVDSVAALTLTDTNTVASTTGMFGQAA